MTTPSQTIGPFFHLGLAPQSDLGSLTGERIRLVCRIRDGDGDGTPVNDAMIEIWQVDASGEYGGFGRQCTNEDGRCEFQAVKTGHVNVMIFARGLLKQLFTRIYFAGQSSNATDPILALVPEGRRETLMAQPDAEDPTAWNFEIRLCADSETVFFDV
jgi:protocatechuate 3,4-dioxygenase alpha subunit